MSKIALAIITGASRGIGYATAQLFLHNGWQVCNISRKQCDLPGVTNIQSDFTNFSIDQVEIQLAELFKQAEKICLVHNASYYQKDSIENLHKQQLIDSLMVGVIVPSQLNQMCLPHMAEGSSIIYVGSTLSEKAVKNTASYTVNKHAVVGLMRVTCQDLDNRGIHTACVCPGFTDTEMVRSHLGDDTQMLDKITRMISARRLITPEEIAQTIQFCADNPVINGSVIHANLGQITK